jgi:hypothetical protein
VRVWDMHEYPGAEDTKSGDIELVSALGFFWGDVLKGAGGYNVVEEGCVFGCVLPIRVERSCIEEHR